MPTTRSYRIAVNKDGTKSLRRQSAAVDFWCAKGASEPVEPLRIVDQNLLPRRRVRNPLGEQVQHAAVIDIKRRRDVRRLTAIDLCGIGMRPVATPDQAIRIGVYERMRERGHLPIIRCGVRRAVCAGDFDISLAATDETAHRAEARLLGAAVGLRAGEMVEDDRNGDFLEFIFERIDDRKPQIDLYVPWAALNLLRRCL